MSELKMQIKVKSYDLTEFETEVSAEEGQSLIGKLKEEKAVRSEIEKLITVRETLGDVLYQPMDEIDKEMYTDAAFKMIDKLIKDIEGSTYAEN